MEGEPGLFSNYPADVAKLSQAIAAAQQVAAYAWHVCTCIHIPPVVHVGLARACPAHIRHMHAHAHSFASADGYPLH